MMHDIYGGITEFFLEVLSQSMSRESHQQIPRNMQLNCKSCCKPLNVSILLEKRSSCFDPGVPSVISSVKTSLACK